jgi:hypothetical protein
MRGVICTAEKIPANSRKNANRLGPSANFLLIIRAADQGMTIAC